MQISVDQIKSLRGATGAGVMDCRRALEEAEGDSTKAEELLRLKGIAKAEKKSGEETREGVIEAYIHSGGRIGALVELNCQTDFVARTSEFKELAHDLAMQVAAMNPDYVDRSEMSQDDQREPEQVCLLQQPFIKDTSRVVQDLVTDMAARIGENVRVRRFTHFALGK